MIWRFSLLHTTLWALLASLAGACRDGSSSKGAGGGALDLQPNRNCALVYRLRFETDVATLTRVSVQPQGTSGWSVAERGGPRRSHNILIAGLRAQSTYRLEVKARDSAGATALERFLVLTTDPLPSTLPPIEVTRSDSAAMADGFTLFDVAVWRPDGVAGSGWLIALDSEGQVVWYFEHKHRPENARLLANGHLVYMHSKNRIVEIDLAGRVRHAWAATNLLKSAEKRKLRREGVAAVAADTFHHDLHELPDGNFMVLSTRLRRLVPSACPQAPSTVTQAWFNVVGDVLVEFERDGGAIVRRIDLFDVFDPCRHHRALDDGHWNHIYAGLQTRDWTHGNTIIYDPAQRVAIVALRNLDRIVAFAYRPGSDSAQSGNAPVAWILGPPTDTPENHDERRLKPAGKELIWPHHAHAPTLTADAGLLM
ncbi:MAG: aryl-sulfate sulfotransferase, partial [Proteobacteria bacterium]|nr:aryl-sulfate sulfotransferase [Pseudomonadota bacterium]